MRNELNSSFAVSGRERWARLPPAGAGAGCSRRFKTGGRRRLLTGALLPLFLFSATMDASAIWSALFNRGTPFASYYLGDYLTSDIYWAFNEDTGTGTHSGFGVKTPGGSYTWYTASWHQQNGANDEWKFTSDATVQFTTTGNHYYAGRFVYWWGTTYCDADWTQDNLALDDNSYFAVSALNTPSGQSASNPGSGTSLNLAWTRGTSGSVKDTLVVRSTSSTFTAPTQGSAYSSGNSIGAGTVIHRGSATSLTDTGLTPGTTYYYAFYAENYSYYSAAVTANATPSYTAPTTQATSVGANNERQTQTGVSWTSGNGSRRIVVARASAAPTGTPADGADYSGTANNNFGSAPALGDGVVVYDGTGSSFTLTGLSADITYYLRVFEYNGTGANTKYITSTATGNPGSGKTLGAPTGVSAAQDGTHPYTRIDLGWTKNNDKNVMVVRSTSSTFTAPTQGSAYSTGAALGGGTVVYNGSATSHEATGLTPGTTYYFAFYSENLSYYSTAATASQATATPTARNSGGSASPGSPAGTLWLGDDGTFTADAWGTVEANWSRARIWLSADVNLGGSDAASSYSSFQNSVGRSLTSPRYFQTGTLYWGLQVDYGSPYNDAFWYKSSSSGYTAMSADGNGAGLSVTVTALNAPTSPGATAAGASQINLTWARGVSGSVKDTLVVRSTSSAFTAPTQGSAYSSGNALGAGTVLYRGTATSYSDTGLSANTTYYYAFYAENWSYYSAAATANATTDAVAPPDAPTTSAATSVGYTSFYANWNVPAGSPTSYRLDVSSDPTFSGEWIAQDVNVGNVTTYQITGLTVGQYFYRVRAVNAGGTSGQSDTRTVNLTTAQGRNRDGGSPSVTPSSLYLGDNATFGVDSWASINDQWGRARAVIDTDNNVLVGGSRGDWTSYTGDGNIQRNPVSPRFSSAGTWYWGVQFQYGTYLTNFWLMRDSSAWADLYYKGTNGNLSVTVSALNSPTSPSGAVDGGSPQTQINLTWARGVSGSAKDTLVVRSTSSTFTAPTQGSTYNSGNSLGAGTVVYRGSATSYSDTGRTPSTTYYYAFYAENWSYYSAGTSPISVTTEGSVPAAPAAYAATSVQTTSFQANWGTSAGATSYRLDVSTVNNFSSFVSGYNDLNVGNVLNASVSGLTAGQTYYYRVRAVNNGGPSDNSSTITVTLPSSSTVGITEIPDGGGGNGTVTFTATVGAYYDIHYSDSDLSGATNWSQYGSSVLATANPMTVNVPEDDRRYFKVTIAGQAANSSPSPVSGVIKANISAGWNLMSPPLVSDYDMAGDLGDELAGQLEGGGSQAVSDQIHAFDNSGNPYVLWLNSGNGTWYEGGSPTARILDPGQGFMIYRQAANGSGQIRFFGQVGNTGAESLTIDGGRWNLLNFSQGKTVSGNPLPGTTISGSPVASYSFGSADRISYMHTDGSWKIYQRFGDGTWRDLDAPGTAINTITMQPGQGYYYYRQSSGGDMTRGF